MSAAPMPSRPWWSRPLRATCALAACAAFAVAGCDEATPFDVNRRNPVEVRFTTDTTALSPSAPGATLRLAVRVLGADRAPVAGWPLVWTSRSASPIATDPQGALSSSTVETDADGVAEVEWTLGAVPAVYRLDVRAAGVAQRNGAVSPRPGPDLTIDTR